MRRAVSADQACAVQGKHHRQVLQCHIVYQLVVAALQESRVNGHHGFEPLTCHARCKRDRVLLGDADVVVATRKALMKLDHARAFTHGGGDADQPRIMRRHVTQPCAEHLCESLFGRRQGFLQAHGRVKLAGAVIGNRISFGHFVALAFFGDHMQKLRAGAVFHQLTDVLQGWYERLQVMPVNRADVVEAKIFKQRGRYHHAFGVRFQPLGQF